LVGVEIDGEVIGLLLKTGWLREADAANRELIGRALAAMLAASART
jgi:hypothetical protein